MGSEYIYVLRLMPPSSAHTTNPIAEAMKTGNFSDGEEEGEGGAGIVPKTVG